MKGLIKWLTHLEKGYLAMDNLLVGEQPVS